MEEERGELSAESDMEWTDRGGRFGDEANGAGIAIQRGQTRKSNAIRGVRDLGGAKDVFGLFTR